MKRSRAKSRDDIMALMHVTYTAEDAVPLQQDTDMMTAQDIWLRKYHELWEKLEENTKKFILHCFVEVAGFDTVMHPIPKCVIFLEDLLQEMVDKKSKDPFGTVRVARKALSKIRELQRGVPSPYGEQFSKETLIKSASSKAFAATTEARIGPNTDPLRDGFQATSLDSDEAVRLLDACMRHQDHFSGFKVATMVLLGTDMGFRGKLHKDPQLDAAGALADLLVFTLNLTGLDILQKIENQDNSWDSGVNLLASGGAGLELLQIWGHWAEGSLGQSYIENNPLAALQAFAIASGWEQSSFMRRHFLGRALARLGNPVAYTGSYPLYVGPGQYDVDPTVDPAVVSPINGGGLWHTDCWACLLPDGRGPIIGGNNINLNGDFLQSGAQAIRAVDPSNLNYTLIGQLDRTHVGVTLTTLGDGNILIMGGNQQEVGAFAADPKPTTMTHTPPTCSPNLGGSVADPDYDNPSFSILNSGNLSQSDIMGALYFSADGASHANSIGDLPNLPVPINYPQYGGFTLLPLEGPNYTQQMGELTLLLDGTAFLSNGAQKGIAGGAGPNHSLANSGTTVAEIYNVSKPVGQRWSKVADSQIQRLYHSVAFLTPNATVLVSGSETTGEHRVHIWTPGYLQNGSPCPVITSAPAVITYGQNFTIQ
ncbi:TPA: hypothetical protein ACH3X1_012246 [Trebouxia sp. C0004]